MSNTHASPTSSTTSTSTSTTSDLPSTMPPINRSGGRNVHIYDANNPTVVLGGLILSNGVTNANFYLMVEILFIFTSTFFLQDETGTRIQKNDHPLQPGKYYIISIDSILINNEPWLIRTISLETGTRVHAFRHAVRWRDRRCLISGKEAIDPDNNEWTGLEAAHIFPLAQEGYWNNNNYGRWISLSPQIGGTINSVQNGLLLRSDIHQLFDSYGVSINPDDNYKIVCFRRDTDGIAGKHLDQKLLHDPQRPVDELLRWHFRQAVLANMRGAGEPIFEHDFPPGSDIVGDILTGLRAAERMEHELFGRLAAQVEIDYS